VREGINWKTIKKQELLQQKDGTGFETTRFPCRIMYNGNRAQQSSKSRGFQRPLWENGCSSHTVITAEQQILSSFLGEK
jgi:hypothetical protein